MTTFNSIWDAIEDTPEEAANMKARSELMRSIEAHIRAKEWTQAEAARMFRVTQPRVSDLMRGKIDLFTIDTLLNMAIAAGLNVKIDIEEVEAA